MEDTTSILTASKVECIVDTVLSESKLSSLEGLAKEYGLSLKQATADDAWTRILKCSGQSSDSEEDEISSLHLFQTGRTPWFFGMEIINKEGKTCGFVTFYIAYSSWNGKILHLDQIQCNNMNEQIERAILQLLGNMAVGIDCARLTWTHKETPKWHQQDSNPPEMHEEVLTLSMDRESMSNYVRESFGDTSTKTTHTLPFTATFVHNSIGSVLKRINSDQYKFQLRLATKLDVEVMCSLVHGLAVYVKEADAVRLGASDYERDGFLNNPLFYSLIVDTKNEKGDYFPCGFAFFFFGYQLGKGRFLHLEDLFIESEHRQGGGGSLAMATLAQIGQVLDLDNFYWQALDWNTGALSFYNKIGANIIDGLKTSRYVAHRPGSLKQFAETTL
ncbi:acyl-CoA N-acyltransferase [Nitzschia inconspicua]|uniref:Acyl-CoA N-acyltransferase n=1 Tax=Nitzschia inconspicua TaxID=303405 RepID=A0A9K3KI37_9STRA|nr:acyl-CoA N-acyltransferase [Nitzschia inconspicua]